MSIGTSQIWKFVDSPKTQKPKHLENKISFFLQIKQNHLLYIEG